MSLLPEERDAVIQQFGKTERDTGSVEVQVALLTVDINKLTEHFKTHKQDNHSRRGLIRKVNLRRKLLAYLKKENIGRYSKVIADLQIRG